MNQKSLKGCQIPTVHNATDHKSLRDCKVPTDLISRWDKLATDCFNQADQHKQARRWVRYHQTRSRARAFQQAADELFGLTDAHLIPGLQDR